jgi:hypothetical protein
MMPLDHPLNRPQTMNLYPSKTEASIPAAMTHPQGGQFSPAASGQISAAVDTCMPEWRECEPDSGPARLPLLTIFPTN